MSEERSTGNLTKVACVNFLLGQPWTGERLIERFVNGYVAQLQSLDGFQEALLARDQRNPDLYVAMTLWESLAQAQSAPELSEDIQQLLVTRSTAGVHEIVGRTFRSGWDGIERRRGERRSGQDRRQASRATSEALVGSGEGEMHPGEAVSTSVESG